MLLQGSLREFNLPNILQLVKMSASTGALSLRRGETRGKIYFSSGSVCYAYAQPQSVPIGQRFVNARVITPSQLREAAAVQRESPGTGRLGSVLVDMGLTDWETLHAMVTEQIQDSVFDFFGWPDGEFEFNDDEVAEDEDIFVEMQVENVIMESCRRIDELEFILEQLGSLESIPRLSGGAAVDQTGEIVFAAEEWNVAFHVDGHSDINTVLFDCDYDRFHGAKVLHRMFERGLVTIAPPATWSVEEGPSVAVHGATDASREMFVRTVAGGNVVRQLRTELIDGRETDVPLLVGRVRRGGEDGDVFVFSVGAPSGEPAHTQFVSHADAWILLVDGRDTQSIAAAAPDLVYVRGLGEVPLVVAAFSRIPAQTMEPVQVRAALGLGPEVPVLSCRLRDADCADAALTAALEGRRARLAEARATS
jgi:hypothetical protein